MLTAIRTSRTGIAATLTALLLTAGCERAHETEACIERLMDEEGLDAAEAQSRCMGQGDAQE